MTLSYTLTVEEHASPEDIQVIHQGLGNYNGQFARNDDFRPLRILVRNQQAEIVGGLLGFFYWGWLAIDILWVHEAWRGSGVGSALLTKAETEARQVGIFRVHLDTMGFQALPFYQKHGYTVWGQLDNFVGDYARYYLKKELTRDL